MELMPRLAAGIVGEGAQVIKRSPDELDGLLSHVQVYNNVYIWPYFTEAL